MAGNDAIGHRSREDYDIVRFLGKERANDDAVAARIGYQGLASIWSDHGP
jgi:hypothetical protein